MASQNQPMRRRWIDAGTPHGYFLRWKRDRHTEIAAIGETKPICGFFTLRPGPLWRAHP